MPDFNLMPRSSALMQALEQSSTSKLLAQLEESGISRLQRQVEAMAGSGWAERTVFRELEALNRAQQMLQSSVRVPPMSEFLARAYEDTVSARLQKQLDAMSSSFTSAARWYQSTQQVLGAVSSAFETQSVSQKLFQSLASSDAFRANAQSLHPWQHYDGLVRSLDRFKEKFDLPPALEHLFESLDHAARAANDESDEALQYEFGPEEQQAATETFEALVQETESAPNGDAQMAQILAAIEGIKDSNRQRALWVILVPILIALVMACINPVADFYVKQRLEKASSPQESTKVVKEGARAAVDDIRQLDDYRYVSIAVGRTLKVRSGVGAKAPLVGELRFGQVVHVVEKAKDFTLIEWRSEDGAAELKGWVFSRYLTRFN